MRTTLDIDEDVLSAIKEIASSRGVSAGRVISELARTALIERAEFEYEDDIPLLPLRPGGEIVTLELIENIREEIML